MEPVIKQSEKMGILNERISRLEIALLTIINLLKGNQSIPSNVLEVAEKLIVERK